MLRSSKASSDTISMLGFFDEFNQIAAEEIGDISTLEND